MDDIANNVGMSKKTVYQYYADKDELVEAVIDSHIGEMEVDCMNCKGEAKDAVHEIFLSMDRVLEQMNDMNPMLLYDLEKFHFPAYQRFRQYKDKFLQRLIRENLEWGIKDELYRPEINIDVMGKFRLESMMIPFNVNVFPPGKTSLGAISQIIMEHFVYGLATIKGHKLIQKYTMQRQKNLNHE